MPSSVLQVIAMLAMVLDHTAYIETYGNAHVIFLNYIGRIAFPIFCFQIALGYKKTKDLSKYIIRLLVIAGISQLPYWLFDSKVILGTPGLNVIFTLLFGILAILLYDFTIENKKIKLNRELNFGEKYSKLSIPQMIGIFIVKIVGIAGLAYLAEIMNLDYGAKGVLLTLSMFALYPFKNETDISENKAFKISKICMYLIVSGIVAYLEAKSYINVVSLGYTMYLDEAIGLVIGVLIGCILPFLYNGKKGKKLKIFGYVFYPIQFIIIVLVNMLIHG